MQGPDVQHRILGDYSVTAAANQPTLLKTTSEYSATSPSAATSPDIPCPQFARQLTRQSGRQRACLRELARAPARPPARLAMRESRCAPALGDDEPVARPAAWRLCVGPSLPWATVQTLVPAVHANALNIYFIVPCIRSRWQAQQEDVLHATVLDHGTPSCGPPPRLSLCWGCP